ncbi:MAG: CoA transferase, partial [Dehalococcoidales bacterium]|nr:CoA transferase [Dehalococcoidales bacterium]
GLLWRIGALRARAGYFEAKQRDISQKAKNLMQKERDSLYKHPLTGLKVLDFTWSAAGPIATKCLADHGADVVKIESANAPDMTRVSMPFKDGIPGRERGGLFHYLNSGKHSLMLNLKHPQANAVTARLVSWADVVVENYAPGTMEKWALGYEDIRKINTGIIMVRASLFGQTGPTRQHPGFGWNLNALAGLDDLTGWPDREAVGPNMPMPDFLTAWYMITVTLAAVDYKRRTGCGQLIDLSEFEATLSYLSPEILDYTVNGRLRTRMGNSSSHAAPHAVYRCRGEDRWCAIAVFTDEEWIAFCDVIGKEEWKSDDVLSSVVGRVQNKEALDKVIDAWTVNYSPEEVVERMQAVGVIAGVVKNARDICDDPQLSFRHHFVPVDHPEVGSYPYPSWPVKLSDTPSEIRRSPLMGEHTEHICTKILGMPDAEFVQLMASGVFE